ncbi:DUF378 domain-containing protein [Lederbergia wuyishanensis]|uniref:Uncharacterized membrane protein YuzA (DUF378 family) n=1 Tax=Lederbergia wuyishanensis TaxID=1347903 RepID=A0ABU0D231_9BACI|nr:DUF378 domain-containing protein [Lederbergia wuyishanensis]MCJ8007375.1 DUF378 domain-containing protein [Lederbergia wuyishanensis]MDQ0342458.1 uncharacterized membrane protein YuzA (DUF378 family) [Lederbergia wuyishanensis]
MKTLRRIALALVIIGAINWGLIGLFRFDLVGSIFGGTDSGLSRFIFTLVGISGLICLGLLFNSETADVGSRDEGNKEVMNGRYATEFAEEPDLDRLYNPSRDAYESEDEEEEFK